jgi:hypothetical protein
VDGDPLVQVQAPRPLALDDLDELVRRLVLVEDAVRRLDAAGGDREQRRDRDHERQRTPSQQDRRRGGEDRGRADERPLRPDQRDRDERGQERAHEAACRREGVEAAGDRAG